MIPAAKNPALEKVAELEPQWRELSQESRQALAYRWVDHVIRKVLPVTLQRAGVSSEALFEALPQLTDVGTLTRARAVLEEMLGRLRAKHEPGSISVAPVVTVLDWLRDLNAAPTIDRACLMTVMTSRLIYNDDRLTLGMLTDVEMACLKELPRSNRAS